tara:strand:- start:9 stop:671 length:663 start_codon:yes stop_codon:yes gene_type:complete
MGMTRQERVALHKKQERLQVGNGVPSVTDMKEGVPELRYVEGTGLTEYTRFNSVLHEKVLDKSNEKEVVKDNICFSLYASAAQNNIAINSDVTIVFGGEEFDLNGNCASNTFTAPVNGLYFLHTNLGFTQFDAVSPGATYFLLKIITSNRTYENWLSKYDWSADTSYHTISLTAIADMDAGDTAYVTIFQSGGNAQLDILADSDNSPSRCYFTGYLIAVV